MSAFHISANLDVPVIDGDSMGRAYPTIGHSEFSFVMSRCFIYRIY